MISKSNFTQKSLSGIWCFENRGFFRF